MNASGPNDNEKSALDALVQGLAILPQNLLSLAVGGLVRAPLPALIARPCNKLFVKAFGINMAEAERPLAEYRTIEDVFTRKLQPGSRRFGDGLISPADGKLVKSEPVNVGRAIQAKGISYSLAELVFGAAGAQGDFHPAWFSTVYLAPHNYHRVHTPCAARAAALRYIPGRLWPVNAPAVRSIPGLFCRNERMVFDLEAKEGGRVWLVMVGALNVGRISTPLKPGFTSNARTRQLGRMAMDHSVLNHDLEQGAEIGTFMLGSTVVLVLDDKAVKTFKPAQLKASRDIRVGQSLSL